ncbi:MAG TPA: hypothetical protein VFQ41_24330 [Candidatus Angelobacter sp.]|nr:hypothetical protein [Candidatus Angelobacter sp.]
MGLRFKFSVFLLVFVMVHAAVPQSNRRTRNYTKGYAWKEFTYPNAGFAITFPQAPKEERLKSVTAYSVYLRDDVFVHVYADNGETTCSGWEEWVKEGKFKPESSLMAGRTPISSSKTAMIKGHIAIVGESPRGAIHAVDYSRQQCLNNRVYSFWARWPADHPRPKDVNRILNSFRVIAPAKP